MRGDNLTLSDESTQDTLFEVRDVITRTFDTPEFRGDHIAMGTNVDPCQRVEGRYHLMPGILEALRDARNPFSILTKGTRVLRDLDLLREASEVADVSVNVSAGFVDESLWRQVEPGTPAPPSQTPAVRGWHGEWAFP